MITAYIAAQIIATGKAFNSFFNMNIILAEIIGTAIVLIYFVAGGFRAIAVSDFFQGLLMLLGLVTVTIIAFVHIDGTPKLVELSSRHPELFKLVPAGFSLMAFFTLIGLMGPGFGFLGSTQIYQRIIAMNKKSSLKKA